MTTSHSNFKKNIFRVTNILFKCTALLLLSTTLTNCSKDDAPIPPPVVLAPLQDPLAGYLTASGFNQNTTNVTNGGDYEFGYSFIPLVNGKMTAIVAKLPEARLAMRVTIWDKATSTILRTETIDVVTANVEVTKQITNLDLVKDKEYFITMNSNDWYEHKKTDNTNVVYPFTVGDIKITSYGFRNGVAQAMPISPINNYYAGDCSFKFQK